MPLVNQRSASIFNKIGVRRSVPHTHEHYAYRLTNPEGHAALQIHSLDGAHVEVREDLSRDDLVRFGHGQIVRALQFAFHASTVFWPTGRRRRWAGRPVAPACCGPELHLRNHYSSPRGLVPWGQSLRATLTNSLSSVHPLIRLGWFPGTPTQTKPRRAANDHDDILNLIFAAPAICGLAAVCRAAYVRADHRRAELIRLDTPGSVELDRAA